MPMPGGILLRTWRGANALRLSVPPMIHPRGSGEWRKLEIRSIRHVNWPRGGRSVYFAIPTASRRAGNSQLLGHLLDAHGLRWLAATSPILADQPLRLYWEWRTAVP